MASVCLLGIQQLRIGDPGALTSNAKSRTVPLLPFHPFTVPFYFGDPINRTGAFALSRPFIYVYVSAA